MTAFGAMETSGTAPLSPVGVNETLASLPRLILRYILVGCRSHALTHLVLLNTRSRFSMAKSFNNSAHFACAKGEVIWKFS